MYNLQSGQHRRRFPVRLTPAEAKKYKLLQLQAEEADDEETLEGPRKFAKGEGKHKGAVTGLTVDGLNRTVISCSDDGKVKVTISTSVEVKHALIFALVLGLYHWNSSPRD
jgi:U3 small nucleolar RNA-associated protein 21